MSKLSASTKIQKDEPSLPSSSLVTPISADLLTEKDTGTPSGTFGFSVKIETDKTLLESRTHDFEFEIPFDDDSVPNESTITMYNLASSTIANFVQGHDLTVTAGYNTDTGVVLKGKISLVKTTHEGVDRVTKVYVLDNADYENIDLVSLTFTESTKASYILKSLLEKLKLPIAEFEVQRDHLYEDETTVTGSITEAIKTYSDICGVSTYINKQQIYCRPIWQGDNIHFTISSKTGMIGAPEPFEEQNTNEEYEDTVTGYNIAMLFQHRMATAAIVDVDSLDYKGTYRVCSGKHVFDGLSATTEIKCIENITTKVIESKKSSSTGSNGISNYAQKALEWAVKIAEDDTHGYDQDSTKRWGPDYDCSSLVISAYEQAGVPVKTAGATCTGDMYDIFIGQGFEDVTSDIKLESGSGCKEGDVLLNVSHHTALYAGSGKIVHASINENNAATGGQTGDQSGHEICVRSYYNKPWDYVLRYPAPEVSGAVAQTVSIRRNIMFDTGRTITPKYLVLHTSCGPGASAQSIANAVDAQGLSIHGVIDEDGVLQTAEWTTRCAHVGSPGNNSCVGFEQCEHSKIKWLGANATSVTWDSAYDSEIKAFHDKLYTNAVALFAYLAEKLDIPTANCISHCEVGQKFGGTDHGDPEEMWKSFVSRWGDNKYTMDAFRSAVDAARTSLSAASSGSTGWITGHTATVYGNTIHDDNGMCGWQNMSYRGIKGCHVAIPTYCIKASSDYNSNYVKQDYPEFVGEGYGTILQVRSSAGSGEAVYAVVADCGDFGPHNTHNHNAALDLPPNTQAALGIPAETVPIEYRVVGKMSSWDGSQSQIEAAAKAAGG